MIQVSLDSELFRIQQPLHTVTLLKGTRTLSSKKEKEEYGAGVLVIPDCVRLYQIIWPYTILWSRQNPRITRSRKIEYKLKLAACALHKKVLLDILMGG